MHKQVHPKSLYWGNTVILLSTIDNADVTNITPISSSWSLSNNIVIGLSLNSKAIENIENCPEVVLNIASDNLSDNIESIAKFTGKDPVPSEKTGFNYCGDKFSLGGFTEQESCTVKPSRIQECLIQVECTVEHITKRNNFAIVELRVSHVHVDTSLLKQDDIIDADLWSPLIYNFRSYHGITSAIGRNFKFDN
ncbi:flavin reductase family protein [Aeromonas dhakensis]|uniref:flavin reductase family protein n=1 Tax=Aeromonas dhakensis TaxID=196024 RepID=UPI001A8E613A|nr:flavin reductase family protein [Aeromonas dhakensis]QSR45207.1 flavin reductase family protein [Aeromonas dhakensis]